MKGERAGRQRRMAAAFTLIEILVVVSIIAVLAALAFPQLIRARCTAHETATVGNLHGLANGLAMYLSTNNTYPLQWQPDMYTSADPDYGPVSFDQDLQSAAVAVQGYWYQYRDPGPTLTLIYSILAHPVVPDLTGTRSFWVNETGEIYHCTGDTAQLTAPAWVRTVKEPPVACP